MDKLSLTILLFFLGTCFLSAQEAGKQWTLEDCVYRAQSRNLEHKHAILAVRSADINRTRAHHARYPSLNLNSSYGYNFGRTIDPTSNEFIATNLGFNSVGASLSLPLFTGGQIHNSIQQANLDYSAASANEENVKRQIVLTIVNSYLSILMSEEMLVNAEYQLSLSREQLKRVDELIASGTEAKNARLDFIAQVSRDEENLVMARNEVASAKLNLLQELLLDIPIEEFRIAKPEIEAVDWAREYIPGLMEILPRALNMDPRIKADSLTMLANKYEIKSARGGFFPSLILSGSISSNYSTEGRKITGFQTISNPLDIEINGQKFTAEIPTEVPRYEKSGYFDQLNSNYGYGFVVGLNIPIFNNYQNKAAVEQAKVNYLQSENQLDQTYWQIKSEIQQITLNAKAAQRSFIAQQNTTDALKEAYENAMLRYEIGAINNFDLLKIQNDYNQAEQSLTSSKYDLIFKLKVIDYYQGKLIIIE